MLYGRTLSLSAYLPEIWGGNMVNEPAFQTRPILQEFISLVTRHWNATCDTLQSDDVFLPLLLNDESGVARANDWVNGFMRGMEMRRDGWAGLMNDEEQAGLPEAERVLGARRRGSATTFRRDAPKVGRNELCPCGSGKKFKHCCARATLH
jgi:uncharacterized protein